MRSFSPTIFDKEEKYEDRDYQSVIYAKNKIFEGIRFRSLVRAAAVKRSARVKNEEGKQALPFPGIQLIDDFSHAR